MQTTDPLQFATPDEFATPEEAAAAALAATSTKDLLRQAYALTHRIDRAGRHEVPATDLRAARDLIDAEVLRRTGEGA